jgi:inhibitor of KinA
VRPLIYPAAGPATKQNEAGAAPRPGAYCHRRRERPAWTAGRDSRGHAVTSFQPLGDQAVLASFAEEGPALRWAGAVRRLNPAWLLDVVQAYTSVAAFFDPDQVTYAGALGALRDLAGAGADSAGRLHEIPCCYERQLDLERVARHTGLAGEEVIRLHTSAEYTVYAIGFCPGFPYLGFLPAPLCGVPRLEAPRLRVEAGSVGLTGRQTGVYTEVRPGGWNLVGRTPLVLVDVAAGYFPLRTGDRVRFVRIDETTFGRLQGRRL